MALHTGSACVGRSVASLRERVESLERKAAGPRAELARLRAVQDRD